MIRQLAVFPHVLVVGSGCMPTLTNEDLGAMEPQRPPQLDLLNAFVGHWDWEGTGCIAGVERPVTFSGTRETVWDGDGWFLVTREIGRAEGLGENKTLIFWSYDACAKGFRMSYVDTAGTTMTGTARYDTSSQTWHIRATSHGPTGKRSAKGEVRFPDPDTMEWTWTEYALAGLKKTMDLSGTCWRKR